MSLVALEPHKLARRIGLRYSSDEKAGISRQRAGKGFVYRDAHGRQLTSRRARKRIETLAIPPAWNDVWICPRENGHLQATGRDAKGRKQYLYHTKWQMRSNQAKFDNLRKFGESLFDLRGTIARHLALPGLARNRVLAAIVALLDRTFMRVGNEEYARANGSHGLSTLRDRHAVVRGNAIRLSFPGKSGVRHVAEVDDARLARIVRGCQELPGQELFQYRENGQRRKVESADVNRYLQTVTGFPFTAKDFRTWSATVLVLEQLLHQPEAALNKSTAKRTVSAAIREAATALGNTVTVCRKYYVHPQLVDAFMSGHLRSQCGAPIRRRRKRLEPREQQLLRYLRRLERHSD